MNKPLLKDERGRFAVRVSFTNYGIVWHVWATSRADAIAQVRRVFDLQELVDGWPLSPRLKWLTTTPKALHVRAQLGLA